MDKLWEKVNYCVKYIISSFMGSKKDFPQAGECEKLNTNQMTAQHQLKTM